MTGYADEFYFLDALLYQHRRLWQFDAFHSLTRPWCEAYPALAEYLDRLDDDALDSPATEHQLRQFLPILDALDKDFPEQPLTPQQVSVTMWPKNLLATIKSRKLAQIQAFVTYVPQQPHYLEWCAGKGHLGRLLAYQRQHPVTSLEWQSELCHQGQALAQQHHIHQTFHACNVLTDDLEVYFSQTQSAAIALHACGDLHTRLIQQAIGAHLPDVVISPCCYHLTQDPYYQPLSTLATRSKLSLRQADLKLAVKQVATAGQREQAQREMELRYRLGFDAWQRHISGIDRYHPVPSIAKSQLKHGFQAFCQWALEHSQLAYPIGSPQQLAPFEQIGQQRRRQLAKTERVSQLFRRPLERWLVLDRALCLQEAGYHIEIGYFCDSNLTPRNLLIRASKAKTTVVSPPPTPPQCGSAI